MRLRAHIIYIICIEILNRFCFFYLASSPTYLLWSVSPEIEYLTVCLRWMWFSAKLHFFLSK